LRGLTSRAVGEKSQKVTRGSHRNDVSPLTQGLRYRAACDMSCNTWQYVMSLLLYQRFWVKATAQNFDVCLCRNCSKSN